MSIFDGASGGAGFLNTGEYSTITPQQYMSGGVVEESAPYGEVPNRSQFFRGETVTPNYYRVDDVIQGIMQEEYNSPGTLQELLDEAENAGFTSLEEALTAASMDDMKETRDYRQYWAERAQNPYIQELVAERRRDGRGGGGPSTTRSVSLSSESQAAAMLDQAFTSYLGRTATDEEVSTWQELLNEAQRANPTVNRVVPGGGVTNVTTSGGFDPTRFAREYAQSQEGYAERYAALNFMNSLDRVLSGSRNALDEFAEGL